MPRRIPFYAFVLFLTIPALASAQTNLVIYNGALASGWQDWSYTDSDNLSATSPVYSGGHSISVTITGAWGAFVPYHAPFDDSAYDYLAFWLNGGQSGGQNLQLYGDLDSVTPQAQRFYLSAPAANTWQKYVVPLSALGVDHATNFSGFAIQDSVGSSEPTFYLDDIELVPAQPPPSVVHIAVNAAQPVRIADARWFGVNVAVWDSALDTADSISTLAAQGVGAMRFPGGSDSDDYHWLYDRQDSNKWTWSTTLANFIHVVTNLNSETMTTLNYGTGSSNEAAAWVAYCNAATSSSVPLGKDSSGFNWQTAGYWATLRAAKPLATDDGRNFLRIGRAAPLGFKYWEIGNEEYGSWETDSNAIPHDPYTYAKRAHDYMTLIRAVDPTVKIGVVVTPGEDGYVNNTDHPAVNPRTGVTHYGWTPVLLATLKSSGALPDFLIHHVYPENPGSETDVGLLQASSNWVADAGNLRQQLSDYIGAYGSAIELVCTENNSVSSNPGKQSVSIVNALYKMDSLAQLMQTEFNGLFWWNLRNGSVNTTGNTNSALFGWREYGDYAVLEGIDYFPTYYTTILMRDFAQTGDTVLSTASDYANLSAYAVRRRDGRLTVLAINKTPTNTFNGQLQIAGFVPDASGLVYSYGIPQDNAAQSGHGSPDIAITNLSGAGTNFTFAFPPYSATVLSFSPAAATLAAPPPPPNATQLVFEIQGQPGAPYIIQNSTDLLNWSPVATNFLQTATASITVPLAASQPAQFWRAVWQP